MGEHLVPRGPVTCRVEADVPPGARRALALRRPRRRPSATAGRLDVDDRRRAGRVPRRGARCAGPAPTRAVARDQSDLRARRARRGAAAPSRCRWSRPRRCRQRPGRRAGRSSAPPMRRRRSRQSAAAPRPSTFALAARRRRAADLRGDAAGRRRPTSRAFDSLVLRGPRRSADARLGAAAGRRAAAAGAGAARSISTRRRAVIACRSTPCCRSARRRQSRPPLAAVTALLRRGRHGARARRAARGRVTVDELWLAR